MSNLREFYRLHTTAHTYAIGFENKHEQAIYAGFFTWEQLTPFIVDDMTAADANGDKLPCIRYKIQRGQRDKLLAGLLPDYTPIKTWRICTTAALRKYAAEEHKNLGEAFEDIACAVLGLKQNPVHGEAWWHGPDAWTEDGEPVQVGYEGKTFTYEGQAARMGWA